ncbi:hypothetical protein BP00DRAFT_357576 [Aspergillus indologenus CBS 114.80]|uniref:CoA-transferase family III n=1 Tax=Aspergillus indologenus CBS 114.80 TaxID=1450541 RepID=A0A2V5IZ16_9EURO|nr:hypothetical protein BP00DRAFT_357576 [Aspergillus indologenus CBS 114.80]
MLYRRIWAVNVRCFKLSSPPSGFETASAGYSVLPPLPVSDITTGLVGALAAMMAVRDRTTQGGSYHVVSLLVATNAVALGPEIGLSPPAVVARTAQRFGFLPATPDQFVSEIMIQVLDGWKQGFEGSVYGEEESRFMTVIEDGRRSSHTPVARLGDVEASPRWTSPPAPNCYHSRDIRWF